MPPVALGWLNYRLTYKTQQDMMAQMMDDLSWHPVLTGMQHRLSEAVQHSDFFLKDVVQSRPIPGCRHVRTS